MSLWLWRENNGPIFTVDEQNIPQTQKSSPSSIQNQGAAHSFFFMLVELSTFLSCPPSCVHLPVPRVPSWRLHSEPDLLQWSFETSEGCHSTEKVRIEEEWWLVFPSWQRSSPFSPQNSWVFGQTFYHCSSPPPLTHLTLLHVISFCSPCSKDLWKEEDLRPFQRLMQMQQKGSRALKKKRT